MSDALSALLHFSDHDFSWLAQFFSLLVLPFAHEDIAIIFGAYIVVNDIMPVGLVALCIYGGMVASDFALYGIGAGARHVPWLTRLAVDDRVRGFADALKRNLFALVALCRVVPGVVFFVFIACGWTRVPLGRFTVASLLVSALYLPLMLCIVIFFGDALDNRVGLWTWPFLLCVLVAIGFVRRQVFAFQDAARPGTSPTPAAARVDRHRTRAGACARKRASAQRIPRSLFRIPLMISWIGFALKHRSLTLPTVANPYRAAGGIWGCSRSSYLLDVAASERRWIADCVVVTRSTGPRTLYADLEQARQSLGAAGLAFPLMAKPDSGRGACRIEDVAALREYLRHVPGGEKVILQRLVPQTGRVTALYARMPGTSSGRLLSLTLRMDGSYRDARQHITPELEARLDAVARSMREFYYGRFALRFASLDDLMRGENFSIVEIDGVGGADSRCCDPALSLAEIYRRAVDQQRIIFLIGDKNRERGFAPVACADVVKSLLRHNQLRGRTPASA